MPSDLARCVVHPARRAVDACPLCARPRCAVDVAAGGGSGCAACRPPGVQGPAPSRSEVMVRSGLAGAASALAGGFVSTQYVGAQYFSVLAPALVGLAASWAVTAAAGRGAGRRLPLLTVAVAAALLGTALGFRLVPGGGQGVLAPAGDVAPPYLAAVVGALGWPVLFGAPRRGSRRSRRGRQP